MNTKTIKSKLDKIGISGGWWGYADMEDIEDLKYDWVTEEIIEFINSYNDKFEDFNLPPSAVKLAKRDIKNLIIEHLKLWK